MNETHRYTMDTDIVFDNQINGIAERKGITRAEVIRRAVAVFDYLGNETDLGRREDRKVSITDQDDNVLKDVIIPF